MASVTPATDTNKMSRNQVINRENPANNQNDSVPFRSVLFCFVFSNPKKIELRVQLMTKGKKRKKTIPKRYVFSEHVGEKPGLALEVVRVEAKPPLAQGGRTVCFCFLCQRVGFCVCEW